LFWYPGLPIPIFGDMWGAPGSCCNCSYTLGSSSSTVTDTSWQSSISIETSTHYPMMDLAIPRNSWCSDSSGCGLGWQPVSKLGENNHYIVVVVIYHDHFCGGGGETFNDDWAGRTHTNDCGHHVFEVWSQ